MEKDNTSLVVKIQQELKVPKGQFNAFGKYKYRSCEDILEAIKPVIGKYKCYLIISDDIVQIGERVYVKATTSLYNNEGCVIAEANAFARESLNKKGMDESQVTGTASSYSRKYALNGLFAIDDTKDADTKDNSNNEQVATSNNGEYVIDFGKFKGKTIDEVGLDPCQNYVDWLEGEAANSNKPIDPNKPVGIFIKQVEARS